MWDPQRLTTLWASMAWYRDSFTLWVQTKSDGDLWLLSNKGRNVILACLRPGFVKFNLTYVNTVPLFAPVDQRGRDSAIRIATGYGLDGRRVGVRVPVSARFSPFYIFQTGSRAPPASYPMGTGGSFSGDKAAEA
jgi:hypothetical protein